MQLKNREDVFIPKVDDFISVRQWYGRDDRSYIGDIFRVMAVDFPFICVREVFSNYNTRPCENKVISLDEALIWKIDDKFASMATMGR